MWDAARLTAVLLAAAVRLWTLRTHLQAFLRGAAAPDVVADVVSDMMQRPAAQGPKRGRAGAALRAKQLADEKKGENEGDRQQQVARAVRSPQLPRPCSQPVTLSAPLFPPLQLRSRYVAHYAFVCAAAALHVAPAVLTSSLALLLLQHVNVDLGVGTALRGALPAALTRRAASSTDDVGAHMMAAALKSLFPGASPVLACLKQCPTTIADACATDDSGPLAQACKWRRSTSFPRSSSTPCSPSSSGGRCWCGSPSAPWVLLTSTSTAKAASAPTRPRATEASRQGKPPLPPPRRRRRDQQAPTLRPSPPPAGRPRVTAVRQPVVRRTGRVLSAPPRPLSLLAFLLGIATDAWKLHRRRKRGIRDEVGQGT